MVKIEESWSKALQEEFQKDYFQRLSAFVHEEYKHHICYPPASEVFNAFNLCPLDKVKVVILGQDPYHGPGQAEGLCFSVKDGIQLPPSLVNIFKEVKNDIGTVPELSAVAAQKGVRSYNGSLRRWAEQGVLLLNATLTVREHEAGSHQRKGWEEFTDAAIRALNRQDRPIVFILWGRPAQMKKSMLNNPHHLILEAPHPSPLSAYRGFFGSKPFSKTNVFLMEHGEKPIDWQIENV